jgi:hygromycin-B 7''-O-kinase
MISFPEKMDPQEFRTWRSDSNLWLPIAIDIARGLSLPRRDVEIFSTGTNLVVGLDDTLVLKIYPPFLRHQHVSERTTLPLLKGRVSVAVPELVADGERDGWPFLVISRLSGELGTDVWPDLRENQKENVLRQIGQTIAEVQSAPLGDLVSLRPQWSAFLRMQIANCRSRHVSLGLPERFLEELDHLTSEALSLIPIDKPPVILTGEYIPENLLLKLRHGHYQLEGIIDFGDVMTGWREYDLLGPSAFMTAGQPGRVEALLSGFGYSKEALSPAFGRRLLALMFLHRASDPLKHICIPGWEHRARTLTELQQILWPLDELFLVRKP